MKGRKPLPSNVHELHGNPGKRGRNKNEPKPAPVAPSCPKWLDSRARYEWTRISAELEHLGLLTKVDRVALAGYCQAYSRLSQLEEAASAYFKKHGKYTTEYTNKNGSTNEITIPELKEAQKYYAIIKAYCAEFGLTPSSRGRINLPGEKDEDDLEDFINRGSKAK